MKVWVNCIVYNEENFIWFAINSIIDFVDKIIVWDTGSQDLTVKIIEEIKKKYPEKIEFKEVGKVSGNSYTKIRQQMLEISKCDWVLILDGDEIWFEDSIKKVTFSGSSPAAILSAVTSATFWRTFSGLS